MVFSPQNQFPPGRGPLGPLSESSDPFWGAVISTLKGKHFSPIARLPVVAGMPGLNKQLSAGCRPSTFTLGHVLLQADRARLSPRWDHSDEDTVSEQGPGIDDLLSSLRLSDLSLPAPVTSCSLNDRFALSGFWCLIPSAVQSLCTSGSLWEIQQPSKDTDYLHICRALVKHDGLMHPAV